MHHYDVYINNQYYGREDSLLDQNKFIRALYQQGEIKIKSLLEPTIRIIQPSDSIRLEEVKE